MKQIEAAAPDVNDPLLRSCVYSTPYFCIKKTRSRQRHNFGAKFFVYATDLRNVM